MLGRTQGVVTYHQARGEIDDQGNRRIAAGLQPLHGGGQQVDTCRRSAVHRVQAKFLEQGLARCRVAAGLAKHAKAGHRVPGQHVAIAGIEQGVA
ncbi:hypothetical protein D3C72_968930 [compost metagenome]